MDKVLIPVDDDLERSLPVFKHAAEIASGVGARATLFHVYGEESFETQLEQFDLGSADPNDLVKRNNTIREAADVLKSEGIPYDLAAAVGSPATEIVKFVENNDFDHIFLGGRHQSPTGKAVLGSVSQQVLLSAELPCTIIISK